MKLAEVLIKIKDKIMGLFHNPYDTQIRRSTFGVTQETMQLAVQINGKLRGTIEVAVDASEDDIGNAAVANIAQFLTGKIIRKQIIIPKRMVNFVVDR